jgi:zinc transport system permease protein
MSYLWTAAGISIIAGVTGLITSFYWSTATGATIVLFTAFLYSISLIVKTAGKNK